MYEIHIAAPVMNSARRQALIAALAAMGLTKAKYFYLVANIQATRASHQHGTPPTGHDLQTPGTMVSARMRSYKEAQRVVLAGMKVLASHKVHGNFEIEKIITRGTPADVVLPLPSGFRQVQDAPLYENHLVWKSPRWCLPSLDFITRMFEETLGLCPHQIVDFGRDENPTDSTIVTRVATVYQPSWEQTMALDDRIGQMPTNYGIQRTVAEQVIVVGEPA